MEHRGYWLSVYFVHIVNRVPVNFYWETAKKIEAKGSRNKIIIKDCRTPCSRKTCRRRGESQVNESQDIKKNKNRRKACRRTTGSPGGKKRANFRVHLDVEEKQRCRQTSKSKARSGKTNKRNPKKRIDNWFLPPSQHWNQKREKDQKIKSTRNIKTNGRNVGSTKVNRKRIQEFKRRRRRGRKGNTVKKVTV